MQVRFSNCRGVRVIDEQEHVFVGTVEGVVIAPDTGVIEGFGVRLPGLWKSSTLFLSSQDILRWGMRVAIRSADVLASPEEIVRLDHLLHEGRPLLGQPIVTQGGDSLGWCADIQFDTKEFRVLWLFPYRFFRWGTPIPVSHVVEVRREAVIVKDIEVPGKETSDLTALPAMPDAA